MVAFWNKCFLFQLWFQAVVESKWTFRIGLIPKVIERVLHGSDKFCFLHPLTTILQTIDDGPCRATKFDKLLQKRMKLSSHSLHYFDGPFMDEGGRLDRSEHPDLFWFSFVFSFLYLSHFRELLQIRRLHIYLELFHMYSCFLGRSRIRLLR